MPIVIYPFNNADHHVNWVGRNCANCVIQKCDIANSIKMVYWAGQKTVPYEIANRMGKFENLHAHTWECPEKQSEPSQTLLIR